MGDVKNAMVTECVSYQHAQGVERQLQNVTVYDRHGRADWKLERCTRERQCECPGSVTPYAGQYTNL